MSGPATKTQARQGKRPQAMEAPEATDQREEPSMSNKTVTPSTDLTQAFAIALEGECDPRREPERGARLDALLDGISYEQLEVIRLACLRLEEAADCAQLR